jgi:hypothetical protein
MNRARAASWSAFLVGLIAGPIAALLLVAAAGLQASVSGWGYAVGAAFTAAGLLSMPWRRRRAFLDHAEECERAIASWLREREA